MSPELEAARENLFHTYLAMAACVPHTTLSLRPEASVAISQTNYSFCNFAMNLHADQHPLALENELRDYCRHRAMFRVFWTTGDSPQNWEARLPHSGFNPISALEIMIASPRRSALFDGWNEAGDEETRHQISAFMGGQFFGMHEASFRKTVIDSTRDAPHALVYLGQAIRPVAAAMIVETPLAVGLYNLCVDAPVRKQGYGKKLVSMFLQRAQERGKVATIQCEGRLVPWYRGQNFESFGKVQSFSLAR